MWVAWFGVQISPTPRTTQIHAVKIPKGRAILPELPTIDPKQLEKAQGGRHSIPNKADTLSIENPNSKLFGKLAQSILSPRSR